MKADALKILADVYDYYGEWFEMMDPEQSLEMIVEVLCSKVAKQDETINRLEMELKGAKAKTWNQ